MPLPRITVTIEGNPRCVRCGKEITLLQKLGYNKETKRCGACETTVKAALNRFRQAFLSFTQDGVITAEEWAGLRRGATNDQIELYEALAFVRGDALNLLERTLAFAAYDGAITDEEEADILRLKEALAIPNSQAEPLMERLAYLKQLTAIRRGVLPTIRSKARIESDELCHMEIPATYYKVTAKGATPMVGQLLATNKALNFFSPGGGWTITYKSVMRIEEQAGGIYLELTKKQGNGRYVVPQPDLASAIIDTLVRIAKRELMIPQEEVKTRHIPQDVKIAVWQRDQGKCVQCGATSYLEFDHIIPHSKGGANTVGNVQLLCRKCNLTKSDSI